MTKLTAVCDEMSAYTDGRRVLDGVYIDFSEDFDMSEADEKTKLLSDMADDIKRGYSHKLEVQI